MRKYVLLANVIPHISIGTDSLYGSCQMTVELSAEPRVGDFIEIGNKMQFNVTRRVLIEKSGTNRLECDVIINMVDYAGNEKRAEKYFTTLLQSGFKKTKANK